MVRGGCYFCGSEVELTDKVFQKDACPRCKKDLHSCVQCRFYDPKAHHQCREPMADFVRDKEKRNSCTYFEFSGRTKAFADAQDARQKLEDLFNKKL